MCIFMFSMLYFMLDGLIFYLNSTTVLFDSYSMADLSDIYKYKEF